MNNTDINVNPGHMNKRALLDNINDAIDLVDMLRMIVNTAAGKSQLEQEVPWGGMGISLRHCRNLLETIAGDVSTFGRAPTNTVGIRPLSERITTVSRSNAAGNKPLRKENLQDELEDDVRELVDKESNPR